MQQLQDATTREPASADGCARELLAAAPAVMRFIRREMRRHRQAGLTVPQFRALIFVSHTDGASVSAVAEHLGLSVPAASRMVTVLVKRGLMKRQSPSHDRRRVSLSLTRRGDAAFRKAHAATRVALARSLDVLPPKELSRIRRAMRAVGRVFAAENGSPNKVK
jgi:DNA-binding MarR family transcriptional regulator